METKKCFIIHKMNGLCEDVINDIRERVTTALKELGKQENWEPEIIDNYTHDGIEVPENAGRLWHLGTSIQQMDDADFIVVPSPSLQKYYYSNGCLVEICALHFYDLPHIVIKEDDDGNLIASHSEFFHGGIDVEELKKNGNRKR